MGIMTRGRQIKAISHFRLSNLAWKMKLKHKRCGNFPAAVGCSELEKKFNSLIPGSSAPVYASALASGLSLV
jgi:hypothetical protein